ncbi:hypothetical protein L596_004621 [Steinernema carpocapsae]|uniref:Uncharacterized protein n=1 Tax=Steinernema carpocapsae TaxID=34508 RepID=A0A4U8UWI8_STECR|nr:hypothetical protein L596_004621 [Steinernema carpocapsae]
MSANRGGVAWPRRPTDNKMICTVGGCGRCAFVTRRATRSPKSRGDRGPDCCCRMAAARTAAGCTGTSAGRSDNSALLLTSHLRPQCNNNVFKTANLATAPVQEETGKVWRLLSSFSSRISFFRRHCWDDNGGWKQRLREVYSRLDSTNNGRLTFRSIVWHHVHIYYY